MSRILLLRSLPLAWVLSVAAGLAQAGPILDQAFEPPVSGPGSLSSGIGGGGLLRDKAQTFTVGLGGLLARVEVLIRINSIEAAGDLLVDVRPTRAGVPVDDDTAPLATLTVPVASVPLTAEFVGFDLSPFGVIVTPGEVLAIVLRSPGSLGGTGYSWLGATGNRYGPGDQYFRSDTVRTWTLSTAGGPMPRTDLGFRTFVDPAAIPEPSGLALLGTGILGLLGYGRCRRNMPA